MKRELLYQLFKGCASNQELSEIRKWVELSPENKELFIQERRFYDAIQLSDTPIEQKRKATHHYMGWTLWGKIAVAIILILSSSVVYLVKDRKDFQEEAMNFISVPAGQRVNMVLADGTSVWLNACSELSYPSSFVGNQREVHLKGEAFFDVAKNKKKQFVVHTGQYDVKVFGTKFNVSVDSSSEKFATTLMQGSVQVYNTKHPDKTIMLTPNNTVYLYKGELVVEPIVDFDSFRWKEGFICFKEISFKELMSRLERNYGLQIIIENKHLDHYMCGGTFRISDGIGDILRVLQRDASFTFEFRNNRSTVYIK